MQPNGFIVFLRFVVSFVFTTQVLAAMPVGNASQPSHFSFEPGVQVAVDFGVQADHGTQSDTSKVRRIRLSVEGGLTEHWDYEIASDVQDRKLDFKDVYASYHQNKVTAYLGQHRPPFGLEALTSSRNITFLERALPDALISDRSLGASVHASNAYFFAAAGAFAGTINEYSNNESDGSSAITARLVFHHHTDRIFHMGIARSWVNDDSVRYSSLPESKLQDVKYINTGKIKNIGGLNKLGYEFAFVDGPASVQAEYIQARISRADEDDAVFSGFYIQTSRFLTGESRPYKLAGGAFGTVRPTRNWGALELAFRYSELDLNAGSIQGGEEQNLTLGLNWYFSTHARITANYIMAHPRVPQSGGDDDDNNGGFWLHSIAARLIVTM